MLLVLENDRQVLYVLVQKIVCDCRPDVILFE